MPSLLDRLRDTWTADTERASERDGYLSYRAEWHSAAFGASVGLLAILTGRVEVLGALLAWALRGSSDAGDLNLPYPKQFTRESAYLLGHAVAGVAVGMGCRVLLGMRPLPASALDLLGVMF
jgi:hypothetical protein